MGPVRTRALARRHSAAVDDGPYFFFISPVSPARSSPDNNSNLRVRATVRAGMQRSIWSTPGHPWCPLLVTGWSFSRQQPNRELIFHN
jgi:hypothetical protein